MLPRVASAAVSCIKNNESVVPRIILQLDRILRHWAWVKTAKNVSKAATFYPNRVCVSARAKPRAA